MTQISPQYRLLINTMLENYDDWEVHSFKIDDQNRLGYGKCAISVWTDGLFLVNWTDCLTCGPAHVNCIEREVITSDAYEALEFASSNGYAR